MTPSTWRLSSFILILAVVGTLYCQSFRNDWTYDDLPVVVENPAAKSLSGFLSSSHPGRPLRELTYIVDYSLFGDRPAGYHVQHLLWHGANGILLFLLLEALGIAALPALLGTLLFLVHPLQVESVANISHRKELLALFFSLGAAHCYLKAVAGKGMRRLIPFVAAGVSFLLALLANETAAALPLALVLYDWAMLPKKDRLLLAYPVVPLVAAIAALVWLVSHYDWLFTVDQLHRVYVKNNFAPVSNYWPLFAGACTVFGFYVSKIVWPAGLAVEYAIPLSADIFQPWAFAGGALLVAAIVAVVALRKRNPVAAFGVGWFLAMYLPVSSFLPFGYLAADRYLYMPLAGLGIVVGAMLPKLPKKLALVAFCLLLLALSSVTVMQNRHWLNEHTLWRHAAKVNPGSSYAQESAAYSHFLTGELDTARTLAKRAIEINRNNVKAYLVLAQIEERRGELGEAVRNYEIFAQSGVKKYPELAEQVRTALPGLQARLRQLELIKRGR